ncbi:MAG TPA: lysylphosphatidylglycerol synthase transmembrane domain-containing protein [Patescibacteria group bacterium]|nr:lysylphosphatidylglycerol synthase transmembrane domain-containing protein [Patescibacteria group bacterium]
MSDQHWLRRRWKLIVNVITILALVVLVLVLRKQIGNTLENLKHVNGWALLLLIPIEALNYHSQARLYQRLFAIVGNKVSYKFLYRTALELNFVNHVFPSGGVTGLSYFTLRLRDGKSISSGKATLMHVLKIGLYFISFEIALIFGVIALSVMGRVNNLVVLLASSITTLLIVGTFIFIYIVGSRQRISSFFTYVTKIINSLIKIVLPKSPETINISKVESMFNDFHDNYQEIKKSYKKLKAPFWYAFLADATEIAAVYVVYIAFGKLVNIGAVILAYGVANFAGVISVLPGGIGVYEALMTGALISMGVKAAISLPATVMYRILNMLIQLPPGYYFYQQAIRKGRKIESV